jgi:hypothetical protein
MANAELIYKKLLEFQKKGIKIARDGENPHFRSTYSTINEVLDKVTKPLNDLDILIVQKPAADGLYTRLIAVEDGSYVEGFLPYVGATDAQKLGGCNTYNRRYSLVTMLGLEDEDDDGNLASNITKPAEKKDYKSEKVVDGEYTLTVLSKKTGETNGRSWEALNTTVGRLFNNSGYQLDENKEYDVIVERGGIVEAKPVGKATQQEINVDDIPF